MEVHGSTRRLARALACAAALSLLAACAGTIKQDPRVRGDISNVEGVSQVVAKMSPDAQKQQADNAQFNSQELANFLSRRLQAKGMIAATASHQVDIVVTDIRVRSAFSAVMFGALAGDDHVIGRVRVLDETGRPLRSFEVQASYSLGGWGGGQDGTRMNWLYDKFTELASVELEKIITAPRQATAVGTVAAGIAAAPVAPQADVPPAASLASTGVALQDADALPGGEKMRAAYREWLTKRPPRAFVVADGGRHNAAWGTNPKDPMDPRDPLERAMKYCRATGKLNCTPYAVDDRVVYVKPQAQAQK